MDLICLIDKIGATARAKGMSAYIVGGIVRDLIAGRQNLDLDIVVEGDAIAIAEDLSGDIGGRLVVHRRFGTCTLTTPDRLRIDFATARSEVYEKPGALPTVRFGSLKDDLWRRDFTINAMAVSIDNAFSGRLLDLYGGLLDIERGCIRVMHDLSFIDDPTRILRAVRFERRFGFTIDPHTERLIHHAAELNALRSVEPQRLRDELVMILSEDDPYGCLKSMERLCGLGFIHQGLRLTGKMALFFHEAGKALRWYGRTYPAGPPLEKWQIHLAGLLSTLGNRQARETLEHYAFKKVVKESIISFLADERRIVLALRERSKVSPSRIFALLRPFSIEMAVAFMASAGHLRASKRIADHLTKYRQVKLSIRGMHLARLGLKPGPLYKKVLNKVLCRKLDGYIKDEQDEIDSVKALTGRP